MLSATWINPDDLLRPDGGKAQGRVPIQGYFFVSTAASSRSSNWTVSFPCQST